MGARFGTAAPAQGRLDRRAVRNVGARGAARVVEQRMRLERVRLDEHVLRVRARGGERLALRVVREEVARVLGVRRVRRVVARRRAALLDLPRDLAAVGGEGRARSARELEDRRVLGSGCDL